MPHTVPAVFLLIGLATSQYWMVTVVAFMILLELIIHGQKAAVVGGTRAFDHLFSKKPVLGARWFDRPRGAPAGGCAPFAIPLHRGHTASKTKSSIGMPSGHATWAGAISIIAVLIGMGTLESRGEPMLSGRGIVGVIAAASFALWIALSRVAYKCHSVAQITVGLLVGCLLGYSMFTLSASEIDEATTELPAPSALRNPEGLHYGLMIGGVTFGSFMLIAMLIKLIHGVKCR